MEGETPQLLLQLSVGQPAVEFTQLLVRAGARADMYSDDVGQERHLAHFKLCFFRRLYSFTYVTRYVRFIRECRITDLSSINEPPLFQAVIHTAILGDFPHIHLPALLGKVMKGLAD